MGIPFLEKRVKLTGRNPSDVTNMDVITVDASVQETHSRPYQVTRHPVSQGIALTDNIRPEPRQLTLVAFFTNTMARIDQSIRRLTENSAEEFYAELEEMADSGFLFEIETSLKSYKNMVIQHLSVPRNANRGHSVEVTIDFVEMRTINAQTGFVFSEEDTTFSKKIPREKGDGAAVASGAKAPVATTVKSGSFLGQKTVESVSKIQHAVK